LRKITRDDERLKKAAQLLLEQYWVVRDKHPDEFDLIKKYEPRLRVWCRDKAGYNLIVHRKMFAKLEKIPANPSEHINLDADTFKRSMDYAIFFCLLSFFESYYDKAFLISEFCEHMLSTFAEKERFLKDYSNRLSLIRVFKYAVKMGILIHRDGDLENFENEVLYKVPHLARYFVRPFPCMVNEGLTNQNAWLNTTLSILQPQQRIYRKLLLEPIFLFSENDEQDVKYTKIHRAIFEDDFADHTPYHIEYFNEGIVTVRDEPQGRMISDYPSDTPISDIALQLAEKLKYLSNELVPDDEGWFSLSRLAWEEYVREDKTENGEYWSQHHSQLSFSKLLQEIEAYLSSWNMLFDSSNHTVRIAPHMLRITGAVVKKGERIHEMVAQSNSAD
jgi:uncharacterized protein (TIGR02678 family)